VWEISNPTFDADMLNDKLRVSPWEGHRKFAYDFVRYVHPNVIVELGSHYGCSLFSFAQAIKDGKLNTFLYAVDTWKGDEHAGYYGEEVFDLVRKTCDQFFQSINIKLLRKTFDEALHDFENNSIDIIHIDGLHTYEAVSHDYYSWLPKLKNNGVVLFHDVYSLANYGSDVFWEEISTQYPNFSLKHSWGLGILFPKGDELYKKLLSENIKDKLQIYEFRARYELESIKNHDLTNMVDARDKAIRSNEIMIQERDALISDQYMMVKNLKSQIASLETASKTIESESAAQIKAKDLIIEKLYNDLVRERESTNKLIEDIANMLKAEICGFTEVKNMMLKKIDEMTVKINKIEEFVEFNRSKRLIFNFGRKNKGDKS
jgi:hypothetical protein